MKLAPLFPVLALILFSQPMVSIQAKERPVVFTSNYPLFYFANRIAGDFVDLRYPVPGDIDPAFWKPEDKDIIAMQSADVIFLNGATYEKWFSKVTLPTSVVYTTSREFADKLISEENSSTHKHGDGEVHSHHGTAFTTWLDLENAAMQARAIGEVLTRKLPDRKKDLKKNMGGLERDLKALDKAFRKAARKLEDKPLLASHPVYQYAAKAYDLKIVSLHWEPETVPVAEEWEGLREVQAKHPAKWMIWEGVPVTASVEKLAAMGIESVVFSPCANRPEEGDWLSVMKENLEAMEAIAP